MYLPMMSSARSVPQQFLTGASSLGVSSVSAFGFLGLAAPASLAETPKRAVICASTWKPGH